MDTTQLINATALYKSSTFRTSDETLIRTTTESSAFNRTTLSNDTHYSTTSAQVLLYKNGKVMNNESSAAITNIIATTVTSSRINDQTASNTDVVVVGVTCGLAGLFLGIIISLVFWMYRKYGFPKKQISALEKNPKERTFEPLDLSLTRPAYKQNLEESCDYQTQDDQNEDQKPCHSYGMPSSSVPRPLFLNKVFESRQHSSNQENNEDSMYSYYKDPWNNKSSSLDSRVLNYVKQNHNCEIQNLEGDWKQISTRESFSSGLGTCTESELHSVESGHALTTSTDPKLFENLPPRSRKLAKSKPEFRLSASFTPSETCNDTETSISQSSTLSKVNITCPPSTESMNSDRQKHHKKSTQPVDPDSHFEELDQNDNYSNSLTSATSLNDDVITINESSVVQDDDDIIDL